MREQVFKSEKPRSLCMIFTVGWLSMDRLEEHASQREPVATQRPGLDSSMKSNFRSLQLQKGKRAYINAKHRDSDLWSEENNYEPPKVNASGMEERNNLIIYRDQVSWRSWSIISTEIKMMNDSIFRFIFGSDINQFCDFEQVL